MNLNEYQKKARETAIYFNVKNGQMLYPALGIVSECGEVAGKVKKLIRDDNWEMKSDRATAIAKELGDCCWYLANVCSDTNLDLKMMYEMRCTSIIHRIRKLTLPRLTLSLNRYANDIAGILDRWSYEYDCCLNESVRFKELPINLSNIIMYIEEIAHRCGYTLEEIYIANTEKLAGRKKRGTLRGEGDDR